MDNNYTDMGDYVSVSVSNNQVGDVNVLMDKEDLSLVKGTLNVIQMRDKYMYAVDSTGAYIHRLVNNTPDGLITFHINGNTLDIRRCNLTTVDQSHRSYYKKAHKNNKVGHKGITYQPAYRNPWHCKVVYKGKIVYQARFDTLGVAIDKIEEAREVIKQGSVGL